MKDLYDDNSWKFNWYQVALLIVGLRTLFFLYEGMVDQLFRIILILSLFTLYLCLLHRWRWIRTQRIIVKYAIFVATGLSLTLLYMIHRSNQYASSYTLWGVLFAPLIMMIPFIPPLPLFFALYLTGKERFLSTSIWFKILILLLVPLTIVALFFVFFALGVWHDSMKRIFYVW